MDLYLGFDAVQYRIQQIADSLQECRNLLNEIEDNLHSSNQLKRGDPEKIAEVDTELLICRSLIQGGWDRINRFKGKAVIATDDEIIFTLDKAFEAVENRLRMVLLDTKSNERSIDYELLITAAKQEFSPLVEELKDLVNRLRGPIDQGSTLNVEALTFVLDRSPSTTASSSNGSIKTIKNSSAALGSSRYDQRGPPSVSYNPQTQKRVSLALSTFSEDIYGYKEELKLLHDQRFQNDGSPISQSLPLRDSNRCISPADHKIGTILQSKRSPATVSCDSSLSNRTRAIFSIQEELPEIDVGTLSLTLVDTQDHDSKVSRDSISDHKVHHSHIYGSSLISLEQLTPDTSVSPISVKSHTFKHELVQNSEIAKYAEAPERFPSRDGNASRNRIYDSVESNPPYNLDQNGRVLSHGFGLPPVPPPNRPLPELPKVAKTSMTPTEETNNAKLTPNSATPPQSNENIDMAAPSLFPPSRFSYDFPKDHDTPLRIGTCGLDSAPSPTSNISDDCDLFIMHPMLLSPMPHRDANGFARTRFPVSGSMSGSSVISRLDSYSAPRVRSINKSSTSAAFPSMLSANAQTTKPNSYEAQKPFAKKFNNFSLKNSISGREKASQEMDADRSAKTMDNDGSKSKAKDKKWTSLTRSVKKSKAHPGLPIAFIPSGSSSGNPKDNLPDPSNHFWHLCENAVAMQLGNGPPGEAKSRTVGILGGGKVTSCKKCTYECSANRKKSNAKVAIMGLPLKQGPAGIMYRETLLFKVHMPGQRIQMSTEEHHFGCIFCAALGNGMPVFRGKTSFLTHLADHGQGSPPHTILKTRINFTTKKEWDLNGRNDDYDLVLP